MCRSLLLLLALSASTPGCSDESGSNQGPSTSGADASPPAGDPDGGAPASADAMTDEPDDGCATASLGDLAGTARVRQNGSGSYTETSARVTWTKVETVACVDRYEPSGAAAAEFALGCCCEDFTYAPAEATIAAAEGALTVDRTAATATYAASGATQWTSTSTCVLEGEDEVTAGVTVGGDWLRDAAGDVGAGGIIKGLVHDGNDDVEWDFAPAAP